MGLVGLLNLLLSILFPLWPWEPFLLFPLIFEILRCKGKLKPVILFLTVFAAVCTRDPNNPSNLPGSRAHWIPVSLGVITGSVSPGSLPGA